MAAAGKLDAAMPTRMLAAVAVEHTDVAGAVKQSMAGEGVGVWA
jgi:ribosome-binding ATPase YchF (GTP1/OBG family)